MERFPALTQRGADSFAATSTWRTQPRADLVGGFARRTRLGCDLALARFTMAAVRFSFVDRSSLSHLRHDAVDHLFFSRQFRRRVAVESFYFLRALGISDLRCLRFRRFGLARPETANR